MMATSKATWRMVLLQTERSLADSACSLPQQLSWTHGWCNFKHTLAWRPTIQQNAFMESWASLIHSSCRASGWCLAALHEWLGYWPRFSNGISEICGKKENPSLIWSWQMFASDNHPTVPCQNVGLAEERQWRKDRLCFYWRRRLSAAPLRRCASLLTTLLFIRASEISNIPALSKKHTQPAPSEQTCEAKLRRGQSVPPHRNGHLSLARINEDDRWGRSASLTEAPRQQSNTNCWNGPDPVENITQVNSGWVGYVKNDKGFRKKIELAYLSCGLKPLLGEESFCGPINRMLSYCHQNKKTSREVGISQQKLVQTRF